jgi:hypothetical protein|tara:strand:+ start:318 stop:842 length:525 start_codon:yes stop_codon:yes gene_type:complete
MKVCIDEMLNLLNEKGYLTADVEEIKKVCLSGDIKKEKNKQSSAERQGKYDTDKCQARIWAEGYDQVQCSFLPQNGTCFCKRHKEDNWWLGKITEEKPEKPVLYSRVYPDGLEHEWKDNKQEEEIIQQEIIEEQPKRRGRPKGSKNKKKNPDGKKPDMSIAEIQALIAQKEQEC